MNFVTRIVSLVLGGVTGSPIVALTLFSFSGFLVYGYLNVNMLLFSGVPLVNARKHLVSSFKLICPFGVILVGLKIVNVGSLFLLAVTCISGVIYYLYIIQTDYMIRTFMSRYKLFRDLEHIFGRFKML